MNNTRKVLVQCGCGEEFVVDIGSNQEQKTTVCPQGHKQVYRGLDRQPDYRPHSSKRGLWAFLAIVGLIALVAWVVSQGAIGLNGKQSPDESEEANIEQCRIEAVTAYMNRQGFDEGDFVVGQENVDWSAPALNEVGSNPVGNTVITSREQFLELYTSGDKTALKIKNNVEKEFPKISPIILYDLDNWEAVQIKVSGTIKGNTGLFAGKIKLVGDAKTEAGDAMWLLVNPNTCKVIEDKDGHVAAVRPGCSNPTDGWSKDPTKDVLANPAVDDWKKDGGDKHTVNNNDGAVDPKGRQEDPEGDAQKAKDAAEQQNQADEQTHQDDVDSSTTADNDEHDSSSGDPGW